MGDGMGTERSFLDGMGWNGDGEIIFCTDVNQQLTKSVTTNMV
jgi:hypothetical protein